MGGSYFEIPSFHRHRVAVDLFAIVHDLLVKRIMHVRLPKCQELGFS